MKTIIAVIYMLIMMPVMAHHNAEHTTFVRGDVGGAMNTFLCDSPDQIRQLAESSGNGTLQATFNSLYQTKNERNEPACVWLNKPTRFIAVAEVEQVTMTVNGEPVPAYIVAILNPNSGRGYFILSKWGVQEASRDKNNKNVSCEYGCISA